MPRHPNPYLRRNADGKPLRSNWDVKDACACGNSKHGRSRMCRACAQRLTIDRMAALMRARRTRLECRHCGVVFWRQKQTRDARIYCSKACAGRARTAVAERNAVITRQAHAIEREIARTIKRELSARLPKATPRYRYLRKQRPAATYRHVCPNCATQFGGSQYRVYCSATCRKRLSHKGRYATIRQIPVDERNKLAELIALTRQANKRLQGQV